MKPVSIISFFLVAATFHSCGPKFSYYQGYIFDDKKEPQIGVKVIEKDFRESFTVTNSAGYFKLLMSEGRISRFLIVEENQQIIDSLQVIRVRGGEQLSYYFVEGRRDTLYLSKK